jgi:4-diphosphocytidyl-2-C-methyl-D-erythritol kinase
MRARRSGSGWEALAPAKLNLYLEILGRRNDGFHELETLMTPVRIYDSLRWMPSTDGAATSFSLEYDSATPAELRTAAPPDSQNLAWRAFEALARSAGISPTGRVTLDKRIPVQAGMGGASSDAAAALVVGNAAWKLNYPRRRLIELAAELGSDVPFFLAGSPAICRGRGERVEPVAGLPQLHLVVVKPPAGVSTAAAFGSLQAGPVTTSAAQDSQARLEVLVDNLRRGALARAARQMVNRLEDAAARLSPGIARLREAFVGCACLGHLMTGSGSAYFGVMRSACQAQRLARQLSAQLKTTARFDAANLGTGNIWRVFATATCHAASPPL